MPKQGIPNLDFDEAFPMKTLKELDPELHKNGVIVLFDFEFNLTALSERDGEYFYDIASTFCPIFPDGDDRYKFNSWMLESDWQLEWGHKFYRSDEKVIIVDPKDLVLYTHWKFLSPRFFMLLENLEK